MNTLLWSPPKKHTLTNVDSAQAEELETTEQDKLQFQVRVYSSILLNQVQSSGVKKKKDFYLFKIFFLFFLRSSQKPLETAAQI